jgi:hypothetical protein
MRKNLVKDFVAYIEKTNKTFDAASINKQRMMIINDAIIRIKSKNLKADTGNILDISRVSRDSSLKDIINTADNGCRVCAKGALFCSLIGRVNQITIDDFDTKVNPNSIESIEMIELQKYFSLEQIDLIETAFEGCSYLEVIKPIEMKKAELFHVTYSDKELRMLAILDNMVENKGIFNP